MQEQELLQICKRSQKIQSKEDVIASTFITEMVQAQKETGVAPVLPIIDFSSSKFIQAQYLALNKAQAEYRSRYLVQVSNNMKEKKEFVMVSNPNSTPKLVGKVSMPKTDQKGNGRVVATRHELQKIHSLFSQ